MRIDFFGVQTTILMANHGEREVGRLTREMESEIHGWTKRWRYSLPHEPQTHEVEVFDQMGVQTTKIPLILFDLRAIVKFRCFSLLNYERKRKSLLFSKQQQIPHRGSVISKENNNIFTVFSFKYSALNYWEITEIVNSWKKQQKNSVIYNCRI